MPIDFHFQLWIGKLALRPKKSQSGARDRKLGISKAGNGYLRKLLVQCAHHAGTFRQRFGASGTNRP